MAGRPPYEVTDEVLEKVEALAAQGLNQEQIGRCLGISHQTMSVKKKAYPALVEAIKNGQAKGLETITNALFAEAKKGNITAQIFYLKNRGPEDWMDRQAVAFSGHIDHRNVEELSDAELATIAARGSAGNTKKANGEKKPARVH